MLSPSSRIIIRASYKSVRTDWWCIVYRVDVCRWDNSVGGQFNVCLIIVVTDTVMEWGIDYRYFSVKTREDKFPSINKAHLQQNLMNLVEPGR